MISKPTFALICFLASRLAQADTLDLYQTLTGKTVLVYSPPPILDEPVVSDLADEKPNLIARIESELSKQGIAVIEDGPHFLILLPEKQRAFLTNGLNLRGAELAKARSQETFPAGTLNAPAVDVQSFLSIYGGISRRTILRSVTLPQNPVRLKTASALGREEVLYAMATVLALNGVALVEDGEKFVQAVPAVQRSMVTARAPKPDPAEKLLDPNKLPSIGDDDFHRPVSKVERDLDRWRKAFYEFMHLKRQPDRSAQRLLGLYASLADKTAEPSHEFDGLPIWFHIDKPVTKSELMYAIEATFDLNWLRIVPVDDQRIRLSRVSERGTHTGKVDPYMTIPQPSQRPRETIVITSKDVDTNTVRVISRPADTVQNLVFRYAGKNSAETEAIARKHPQVQIVRDGRVIAETTEGGCTGYLDGAQGQRVYVGLVLIFGNYDQAKLAEKTLRGD